MRVAVAASKTSRRSGCGRVLFIAHAPLQEFEDFEFTGHVALE